MICVTCLGYEKKNSESTGAKISSTEEQQKYNLVKIMKKNMAKKVEKVEKFHVHLILPELKICAELSITFQNFLTIPMFL